MASVSGGGAESKHNGVLLNEPPTDGISTVTFAPASDLLLASSWDSVSSDIIACGRRQFSSIMYTNRLVVPVSRVVCVSLVTLLGRVAGIPYIPRS